MEELKRFIFGLLILLAVFSVTSRVLPGVIEGIIEENIGEQLEYCDELKVELEASPALRLLLGRADSFRVNLSRFRAVGTPEVGRLEAVFTGIALDLGRLLGEREVEFSSLTNDFLLLELEEEALNSYLQEQLQEYQEYGGLFNLRLEEEGALLETGVGIFNQEVNLAVSGDFRLAEDPARARFVIRGLEVEHLELPRALFSALVEDLELFVDLSWVPPELEMHEVRTSPGKLRVIGPQGRE